MDEYGFPISMNWSSSLSLHVTEARIETIERNALLFNGMKIKTMQTGAEQDDFENYLSLCLNKTGSFNRDRLLQGKDGFYVPSKSPLRRHW